MENDKPSRSTKPPKFYEEFLRKYSTAGTKYEELGNAIHRLSPLNDRERAL